MFSNLCSTFTFQHANECIQPAHHFNPFHSRTHSNSCRISPLVPYPIPSRSLTPEPVPSVGSPVSPNSATSSFLQLKQFDNDGATVQQARQYRNHNPHSSFIINDKLSIPSSLSCAYVLNVEKSGAIYEVKNSSEMLATAAPHPRLKIAGQLSSLQCWVFFWVFIFVVPLLWAIDDIPSTQLVCEPQEDRSLVCQFRIDTKHINHVGQHRDIPVRHCPEGHD